MIAFGSLDNSSMILPGDPKKVLLFDKASNNRILFYYLNVLRIGKYIHKRRF